MGNNSETQIYRFIEKEFACELGSTLKLGCVVVFAAILDYFEVRTKKKHARVNPGDLKNVIHT